jgi:hypothetical protein
VEIVTSSLRSAALTVVLIALLGSPASANRRFPITPINAPDAPFPLYNCTGLDIYDVIRRGKELKSYFTNISGKDITAVGVHYRLLRLDGSQVIGFTIVGDKRVTAGTKNNLETRILVRIDDVDHAECAPSYAKFSDGTEWSYHGFNDAPQPAKPSPAPSAAASAVPSPSP